MRHRTTCPAGPAAEVRASAEGLGGGRGQIVDPQAFARDADDAGHGDCGAGRPAVGEDDPQGVVRELGQACLPVDPVSRTTYRPGEPAQCDLWFPEADIPLGHGQTGRPPVLVMVSGCSWMIAGRMLPSRRTGDHDPGPVGERLAIATAEYNNCTYCLSAHTCIGARVAKVGAGGLECARHAESAARRRSAGPVPRRCPRPHR
jgi:AhpD family alkylhydroperoxidase